MVFAKYSLERTSSVVDISSSGSLFDQRSQLSPRLRSSGAHEAYNEQPSKISDFTLDPEGLGAAATIRHLVIVRMNPHARRDLAILRVNNGHRLRPFRPPSWN
jgi:hypothetical protein